MINSDNIINYNRTDTELEELILFLICVAGKPAKRTERLLGEFLNGYNCSPFEVIRSLDECGNSDNLKNCIKHYGFGCYTRITRTFREITNSGLDLRTCTLEDLMSIHGIGRKSASCFICWTRKGARLAMLDTHILQELKDRGIENVPKSTPTSKKEYNRLEKAVLEMADKEGKNPVEWDLEIWVKRSRR